MIFMVLSSWQAIARVHPIHLMNAALYGQIKPTNLLSGLRVRQKRQLPSPSTIAIYYYLARELIFILPSHGGWKAEST